MYNYFESLPKNKYTEILIYLITFTNNANKPKLLTFTQNCWLFFIYTKNPLQLPDYQASYCLLSGKLKGVTLALSSNSILHHSKFSNLTLSRTWQIHTHTLDKEWQVKYSCHQNFSCRPCYWSKFPQRPQKKQTDTKS